MSALPPIEDRIKQLEAERKEKRDIVNILYTEGYLPKDIMSQGMSLRYIRKKTDVDDNTIQAIIAGVPGKGLGYIAEWKELVRHQMSTSRQLTNVFYDLGLTILLASLSKSGLTIEEFSKIFKEEGQLRAALTTASETAFNALEYYKADAMSNLEKERDEARAYSILLEDSMDKVSKELEQALDPKLRLEKMIYNMVLMSGSTPIDPQALQTLINSWLTIEISLPSLQEVVHK